MMMRRISNSNLLLLLLSIVYCSRLTLVHCTDPLYTISAPNTFRPNGPYQLIVTIHQAPSPVDVVATIKAQNNFNNETRELRSETTIPSGQSKMLQLDIGDDVSSGNYELRVSGKGGIDFNKTASLSYSSKTFSVFIQTDKAIYKPGQIVHFRLICTDVSLKPHDLKDANIFVIDSQSNRVKQWTNISLTKGIFQDEIQLSDQVILGDWHIRADVKGEQFVKYFSIDEYVLPTFEVEVQPPPYAIYNESKVPITVHAKYTYGKPVKGKVLVNVTDFYCKWPCQPYNMKPFSISTSIDGKAEVIVDFVKDLALPEWMRHEKRFAIFAEVTEELTGRKQNGSGAITLYDTKYKLSFSDGGNFKPGLKYTTTLQVSLQDGSPLIEEDEISVSYYTSWNLPATLLNYTIPRSGEIEIEITAPDNTDTLRFETSYKGARSSSYINRAQSLSERFLQITLTSAENKVGGKATLNIDSTKPLNDVLILQVIGRGKILFWEVIEPSKSTSQQISFLLTPEMAPKVRVIVYYATSCGEVVADAVDFSVDGIFKTNVAIEASPNSTKPGSKLEVSVATQPHAYVGLLAIDQSVLLLKSGNDITTKEILDDLQSYEIGRYSYYSSYNDGGYFLRPWRPSSPSTMQLFLHVGLVFFTNGLMAHIPTYDGFDGYDSYDSIGIVDSELDDVAAPRPAMQSSPQNFMGGFANPSTATRTELMEPSRVRRHFPETFLWTNATASADGIVSIETVAPDTITSYFITAFAMDEANGLGLSKSPAKLRIFRPYFVVLNLPYSIVRGEYVALQAIVFNYLKDDVETEVTLDNEQNALQFVELDNTVDDEKTQKFLTKKVKAKANEGTSVTFLVAAKKIDYIDVKVTARSAVAADAILKKLLVKAEGQPIHTNKAYLVDLRNGGKFEEKMDVKIPSDAVADSEKIEVSAIGDVMGTTVNNLDKLLRMPYGCGEQNMLNFVPNIVVTEYLTQSKQLTERLKSTATRYMESGYQRQLTYKRRDNSFSAFGNSDKEGSVWLTAFVVKSFIQARPYITIDDNVIRNSLNWLATHQTENGSFNEVGTVFHKAMQGGSGGGGIALTAYVLSAFLEAKRLELSDIDIKSIVSKTVELLEKEVSNLDSDYDLAIATYVLHLAESSKKDAAFDKLKQRAKTEKDFVHWSVPLPPINESDPFARYNQPKPQDVEMTSYALLTYVARGEIPAAIPIMRWLVSKRNQNGGFESTQDTVMGILALAKFAATLTPPENSHLNVVANYGDEKKEFSITKETALILNREKLPRTVREVTLSATGNGVGVVQVSWSYNVLSVAQQPAFAIVTNVTSHNDELNVEACTKYIYEVNEESNMAVVEVEFPSGYVADLTSIPVDDEKKIKRVETKDGDTVAVVYFDSISNEVCIEARAHRAFKVANAKPAIVKVYDYYDPAKNAQQYYTSPTSVSVCELCETADCRKREKCTE